MCQHVIVQDIVETPDGKDIHLNSHTNSLMDNLVYGIACNRCSKILYVGETGTPLYSRVMNHWSHVRKKLKGGTNCGTFYQERTLYYRYESYRDRESQDKQYNIQKNKRIKLDRQNGHFNKWREQKRMIKISGPTQY